MKNLFETILRNTKPDPNMWVWYKGKLYLKNEAAKLVSAVNKNEQAD